MDLKIKRKKGYKGYCPGKLYVQNKYFSFTIEDEDRGLTQSMSLKQIQKIKKYGITAIPIGRYEIAYTYSNRFKRFMLQILNVPGYEGVRIHVANTAKDVEGCVGAAYEDSTDGFAGKSKDAIEALDLVMKPATKVEKCFITIEYE
jgi:hypothetical protein